MLEKWTTNALLQKLIESVIYLVFLFLNWWPLTINWFNLILCIKESSAQFVFIFDFQRPHPPSTFTHKRRFDLHCPCPTSEARAGKAFRQLLLSSEGGWGREGSKQTEIFHSRPFTAVPITASPWFTMTETVRDRINERGKEKKTKD